MKSKLYRTCAQINQLIHEVRDCVENTDLSIKRPQSNTGNFYDIGHFSDPINICINCKGFMTTMFPSDSHADMSSIDLLYNAKPIQLKTSHDYVLRQNIKDLK